MVRFQDDITVNNKNPDIPPVIVAPQDNTKVVINFKDPFPKTFDNTKLNKALNDVIENSPEYKKGVLHKAVKTVLPDASEKFIQQIQETAEKLKCDELDVAALIYKESKFQQTAANGSYRGLGQMNRRSLALSIKYAKNNPEESKDIDPNMTFEKFVKLPREKQMPYVKNYALTMKETYLGKDKKITGGDLYALFVTPGFAKNYTLLKANNRQPKLRKMYRSNRGLDKINSQGRKIRDGKITKDDLQFTLDSIKTDVFKVDKKILRKTFDTKG